MQTTPRTQVRRLPKRAVHDESQIQAILDEAYLCHVGFTVDEQPFVIPTLYARVDDQLYLHGSAASRMLRTAGEGIPLCVTVTLVDGFVLARSVFHHSMNYRSVMVLGTARLVVDAEEKSKALRAFTNKVVKGRWEEARQPNESEFKATHVLALPLDEVSAKVRNGPPADDEEDYAIPIWAGVVPIRIELGEPRDDGRVPSSVPTFDSSRLLKRLS